MKRDHPGDPAAGFFSCTEGERAAFEAGIKLGALFHQFIGVPLSTSNAGDVEEAMRASLMVQPFVRKADVAVDRDGLHPKEGEYDYTILTPERLRVSMEVAYGESVVEAGMRYVEELGYPLMFLRKRK
ncbi:MAG: dihydroneopterin aldolase family protein [Thermoplasmata archaeon]|nr:dihydroneopterin aldolase family protein [Thermoplasmata archaeon]